MLSTDLPPVSTGSSTKRRKSNFGKEMPSAVPGVGECRICFEVVPCVKVLDCNHCLCIPCLTKLADQKKLQIEGAASGAKTTCIDCPECRQKTDCSQGVASLKTLYFGKIRCDLCLEKKDTDDMWWCPDCVQTICSKCSIKEHSKKGHHISEWNKMEPVKYSIQYLTQVKCARQESGGSETNRALIKSFLDQVEKCLLKELQIEPDLEDLHYNLVSRYGTRFASSSRPTSTATPPSTPTGMSADMHEGAPKVVAKVLQLAGANILEAVIPKLCSRGFQIEFNVKPEEAAKFLRSKLDFAPVETAAPIVRRSNSSQDNENDTTATTFESNVEEGVFVKPSMNGSVEQAIYGIHTELIALRSVNEISIYNLHNNTVQFVPVQLKLDCRSICFGQRPYELLIAYQSNIKRHEWLLEFVNVERTPPVSMFTTAFDIDPDDHIVDMHCYWCDAQSALYEVRINEQQKVSEIWKAVVIKKRDKPKLKETLIYQKAQSKVTALQVVVLSNSKEYHLFVWDEAAYSVLRLTVRDNRCYSVTKIITSPSPISFVLDTKNKLWLYDPHLKQLCHSYGSAVGKTNLEFKQVFSFNKFNLDSIYYTPDAIIGLMVDKSNVHLLKFKKEIKQSPVQQQTQPTPQPTTKNGGQKKLMTWQSQPILTASQRTTSPVKNTIPHLNTQMSAQNQQFKPSTSPKNRP